MNKTELRLYYKEIEKLYSEALNAMREYSGNLGEDNNNYD